MIELFENQLIEQNRQSSKGNQLKWCDGEHWYKADYTGYEGFSEYVISHLLQKSSLDDSEYVLYETEEIKYNLQVFKGCKSKRFLKDDWQIITLERLFQSFMGEGLNKCIYRISGNEERLNFIVEQTERITGLRDFDKYICKLLTIDTLFLNEDRHTHNLAVLMNGKGEYDFCPIFDNGAGLLSDITMDYPLHGNLYELIDKVKPKTFCQNFDEQLECAEKLYGRHMQLYFTKDDVNKLIDAVEYDDNIKVRVKNIIFDRMRTYQYLFER